MHYLKGVNSVISCWSLLFSTQLLLKIPVFELNNRFVFHGTFATDIVDIANNGLFLYHSSLSF